MRRFRWLICLGLCLGSIGCVLTDWRREKPGITYSWGSAKAREIESHMDWDEL